MKAVAILAAWTLGAGLASAAMASSPDAPLGLATGGTFGRLFLEPTAADARALPAPALEVRWTLENDWSTPTAVTRGGGTVLLRSDEQSDALTVSLRAPWSRPPRSPRGAGPRGLLPRLSTEVDLRLIEHWGGWTDGPIEAWHHLAGFGDFQRNASPRGAVSVALEDPATGKGLAVSGPRLALGDLVVRTQLLAADGGTSLTDPERARWALALRLDLKAPLGDPARLGGSGGFDFGSVALATAELTPWLTCHALLAATAVSRLAVATPLQPRRLRWTAEVSLAARAGALTLLLEDRVSTALFEGGWQRVASGGVPGLLSSAFYGAFYPQNRVAGGVRWGAFTLFFSEDWTPGAAPGATRPDNWFYNSNAPDLAAGLSFARAL